jgi:glycosyltransferase involved in cell wall biosynthesis
MTPKRILVHDYSGHPFQVELSRELARRGHEVTHSWSEAYVSGKGHLAGKDGESLQFETIDKGVVADKRFVFRLFQEVRAGFELARQARRIRPDVALMSNVQVPSLVIFAVAMAFSRIPWVLWHQDVYAVAVRSFAGAKLPHGYRFVAFMIGLAERWSSKRAAAIVAISSSVAEVHNEWGTGSKTTVIPNWAPLDEIVPVERKNDWAVEHQLDDTLTLLYSGTLGLKHNPALLVELARGVIDAGRDVRLVVVNDGPAREVLQSEAERLDVPLSLLPFQPYERLSEVLGTGDILVVLLDQDAGAFSVPSKTLSYLCAGRPILGLMPSENLAAELIESVGGGVWAPDSSAVPVAASWAAELLGDAERLKALGVASRELAESEFALPALADSFEEILVGVAR